jgi:NADH-ubiquinone oxidoreductase chain 5
MLSIFIGFLTKDLFIGFGTDFWGGALFISPFNYLLSDIEFIETKYKILPFLVTLCGAGASYLLYRFFLKQYFVIKRTMLFKFFYVFFNKK